MPNAFDRVLEWITTAAKWTMVLLAGVIFLITISTVFTRYLLNFVPSWSEEVPRYLLVWITYLGAALAVKFREHISLDVFFNLLPPQGRRVGHLILNGLIAIVGVMMVVYGVGLVRHFGDDLMESIPVTNFWLYLAMPTSGTLILLYLIQGSWRRIRGLDGREEPGASEVVPI